MASATTLARQNCQQSKWDILDGILGDCYRLRNELGLNPEVPQVSLDPYEDQLTDAQAELTAVKEFAQERADRIALEARGELPPSRANVLMAALIARSEITLARRQATMETLSFLPTIMEENPPTPIEAWVSTYALWCP